MNAEAESCSVAAREELLGQSFGQKFPELAGSLFEENYRRSHGDQMAGGVRGAAMSTGKIWFEVHAYPSGGGVSVFFRDMTERKRAEDERLTTSKLESLGTLAGGIAHDLNNILTVISGNIGLAQIEAPSERSGICSRSSPKRDRRRSTPPIFPVSC